MRRILFFLLAFIAACGGRDPEEAALLDVKAYIEAEIDLLHAAAVDLRAAAPTPDADGWSPSSDAAAVDAMKEAWRRARIAYEHIEGAIAVLFPMLDRSTDERYDGFIEAAPDDDLFDGMGATGVHAIERILWADMHPPEVVAFESALPGYVAASFPSNETEATSFRDGLLSRLVDDVERMRTDFRPLALDAPAAFRGVIGSMEEQLEKVRLAATGEDESRYAQFTLGDMRANLDGGRSIYGTFVDWLAEQPDGAALDARIQSGFDRIGDRYGALPGDRIPLVPATWNPDAPSPTDLATPYGQLYELLTTESDPANAESLVSAMSAGADAIGIPQLP